MSQRRSRVLMVENRLAVVFGVRRLAAALSAAACRGSKLPRRKRCQGTALQRTSEPEEHSHVRLALIQVVVVAVVTAAAIVSVVAERREVAALFDPQSHVPTDGHLHAD